MYNPSLGRWNGLDQSAENYVAYSPYHYSGNSPIRFVDFDGNDFGIKIDHKTKTIQITSNVYTYSDKGYKQALKGAGAWNSTSGKYGGYAVSFNIKVVKPAAVTTSEVLETFTTVDFQKKNGNLNTRLVNKYKKALEKQKSYTNASNDNIGNVYASGDDKGINSKKVSGSKYTGGVTQDGKYISMNEHSEEGDIGQKSEYVEHEIGHTLGLNDEGKGSYFAEDGIMEYSNPMHSISDSDLKNVVDYALDGANGAANVEKSEIHIDKIAPIKDLPKL